MSFIKINWKPNSRELRIFGCSIFIGMGLAGSLFFFVFSKIGFAYFLWGCGSTFFLFCITGKAIALPFYWLWMGFIYTITQSLGYISLTMIYYLILTPIGLFSRMTGRDRLKLKRIETQTYWQNIVEQERKEQYERQF
jgi:hypothetical protein